MSRPDIHPVVNHIVERIISDPAAANEAKQRVLELARNGDLATLGAALMSTDPVRAHWRPAVGWVCVAGLFYNFLLRPLLPWFGSIAGVPAPELPQIDMIELMSLLLGLGGLRTIERLKGKA